MRSLQTTRNAAFKAALLAGGAGFIAIAQPALAQDNGPAVPAKEPAQCDPAVDKNCTTTPTEATNPNQPGIVVTGSRIVRKDYESNSPTVTVDENFLKDSSTGAVEQQLNKLPQFVVSQSSTVKNNEGVLTNAGGDIQPNATNTPGAATVSLRGVGANRTLVLIDGRRGTPGNASGTVDVSMIPSSALERVEVISGGASATYGADAVAGVTNFILKKNFQGLELDAQSGMSQYGDSFEYTISGIMGSDFADGRGNVSIAMSTNKRNGSFQKDRPWFRDLWANPDTTAGSGFFVTRPGISLQALPNNTATPFPPAPACGTTPQGCVLTNMFPGANPPVPNNTTGIYLNPDGSIFTTGYPARGGSQFIEPWPAYDSVQGSQYGFTSQGVLKSIDSFNELTVPTTRYNFLARGNYEINDWIGVFAQGMFAETKTHTIQEPGPIVGGWGVSLPWGSGTYVGNAAVPSSVLADGVTTNPAFQAMFPYLNCVGYTTHVGGCTNTEAEQQVVPASIQALANARTNPNAPINLAGTLPNPRENFNSVFVYNLVAGLQGSIPDTDWTWEASVNQGRSTSLARQTGMYSLERTRDVFGAPNMGQGFHYTGNQDNNGAGFGAATGTCTSGMNFFQGYEGITQDCREAIAADMSTKSVARQTIWEFDATGSLFQLPAGPLQVAVGADYRVEGYQFINETLATAGRSFLDQAIGIYPSANFDGSYNTKEVYGELAVPILKDTLIKELSLELGGRISDYSTTGTSYTYKALANLALTDWLRFRGGYNRAERAPNIAELLLTPQQAFRSDPTGDLCSTQLQNPASADPASNPSGAADVQAVCQALIARDNGGVYVPTTSTSSFYGPIWGAFQPTGPGAGFGYAVGNQVYRETIDPTAPALKPEKASTWTLGAVISSPFDTPVLRRLQVAVDYFNITIKDPIGLDSAGAALQRCIDPAFNPAVAGASAGGVDSAQSIALANAAIQNAACEAVFRNPSTGAFPGGLNTARIITTYTNKGLVKLDGIDAQLNWSADVGPGTLFIGLNGNYMLHFKVRDSDSGPLIDYVGTLGTGLKGLNYGSSFRWKLLGNIGYTWKALSLSLQWQHTPHTEDSGEAFGHTDDNGIPSYDLFNLNGSYQLTDNVRIRFGVDNLFNTPPPLSDVDVDLSNNAAGSVAGGGFNFFTDQEGRRFSLGANLKF